MFTVLDLRRIKKVGIEFASSQLEVIQCGASYYGALDRQVTKHIYMVNIKNIIGTSGQQLADGRSWLDFYGGNKPIPGLCPVCRRNDVEVGAHVTVYGYPGTYLAPLCKQCNHYTNTGWMHIDERLLLKIRN